LRKLPSILFTRAYKRSSSRSFIKIADQDQITKDMQQFTQARSSKTKNLKHKHNLQCFMVKVTDIGSSFYSNLSIEKYATAVKFVFL
jgi:hypothetical protein